MREFGVDEAFEDVIGTLLARGLSQSEVARGGQVDRSRVSEWRRGLGVPSPQTLERLANAFGLDLDHLMRICGYQTGPRATASNHDETELLVLFRQVPEHRRDVVKDLIRGLAVQPTQRPANRRRDALDNRPPTAGRKLVPGRPNQGDQGINRPITPDYARAGNYVRATIAVVKGWLAAPSHRPMLPTAG